MLEKYTRIENQLFSFPGFTMIYRALLLHRSFTGAPSKHLSEIFFILKPFVTHES